MRLIILFSLLVLALSFSACSTMQDLIAAQGDPDNGATLTLGVVKIPIPIGGCEPGDGQQFQDPYDARHGDEIIDPQTGIATDCGQIVNNTSIDPVIQDREKGFAHYEMGRIRPQRPLNEEIPRNETARRRRNQDRDSEALQIGHLRGSGQIRPARDRDEDRRKSDSRRWR